MIGGRKIFRKIDSLIFNQLDIVKSTVYYQKALNYISSLGDSRQKLVIQLFSVALTTLPIIVFMLFFIKNCSLKSELNQSKEILSLINGYKNSKNQLSLIRRYSSSTIEATTAAALKTKAIQLLTSKGIDIKKVQMKNLQEGSPTDTFPKIEADFTFKNFALTDLTKMLSSFLDTARFKIPLIKLQKNRNTKLLSGEIHIIHFGKAKRL